MEATKLAERLVDASTTPGEGPAMDRFILRLAEHPSLLSYLNDMGRAADGRLELDFFELPAKAIETVTRLAGPVKVEVFSYIHDRDHVPHTGFRIDMAPLAKGEEAALHAGT